MDDKVKIIYASEAKADAKDAQIKNFDMAMQRIAGAAKNGLEEILLFGIGLNMDGVKKLMDLGYSVSTVLHPFEQVKMYKVSW